MYIKVKYVSRLGKYIAGKQIQVYISEDIRLWLEEKAKQGYKKATLIRHILL